MTPRDPLAQYQFAHIRIFTSASTVMGSISIQSVGHLALTDSVKAWLGKNSANQAEDSIDAIELILDGFRRTHLYDKPAELEAYAKTFYDLVDLSQVRKLV